MKTMGKSKPQAHNYKDSHPEGNPMHSLFNNKLPPVPTVPLISQSALSQLQQLYGKQIETKPQETEYGVGTLPADKMETHVHLAKTLGNAKIKELSEDLKDVTLD